MISGSRSSAAGDRILIGCESSRKVWTFGPLRWSVRAIAAARGRSPRWELPRAGRDRAAARSEPVGDDAGPGRSAGGRRPGRDEPVPIPPRVARMSQEARRHEGAHPRGAIPFEDAHRGPPMPIEAPLGVALYGLSGLQMRRAASTPLPPRCMHSARRDRLAEGPTRVARSGPARAGRASLADRPSAGARRGAKSKSFPPRRPVGGDTGAGVVFGEECLFSPLRAIRSVFSICNALCKGGLLTLPDVPPSVCYPSGRHRQRRGPKPGGQRNLDLRIGRGRASRHGDCQHHGGRGPAVRVRSTQVKC